MIIPFIPEDLFELNNNIQPKFNKEIIIIDNVFKNYKDILKEVFKDMVVDVRKKIISFNLLDAVKNLDIKQIEDKVKDKLKNKLKGLIN